MVGSEREVGVQHMVKCYENMPVTTSRTLGVTADCKTDTSRNEGKYRICKNHMGNGGS